MRHTQLSLLFVFIFALTFVAGCGGSSGPAKEVADQNEIDKFLAENPELNEDQDEGMEDEGDE